MTEHPSTGTVPPGLRPIEGTGGWTVCDRATAEAALLDPHLGTVPDPAFATQRVPEPDRALTVSEFFGLWFSRSPFHQRVGRELRHPYGARCVAGFAEFFDGIATELLADLPPEGELMADFLTPYGMHTTFRMMDAPRGEWSNLHTVTTLLMSFLKKPLRGETATPREVRAVEGCVRYLRALVDRMFAAPGPGELAAGFRALAGADGADVWLTVATVGQLLTAGVEPMTTGAGVAARALYADPALAEAVRGGEITVEQIAEEAMRLHPPFPHIYRWAHEPCDCLGVRIEPGSQVITDVRAVNRDPEVVADPTEFRPQRSRNTNLTFGRGAHYCLGTTSGRTQIAVALRRLLADHPDLVVHTDHSTVDDLGYALVVEKLPYSTGTGETVSSA